MSKDITVTLTIPTPRAPAEIEDQADFNLWGRCGAGCPFLAHGEPSQYCTRRWNDACGDWSIQPGPQCPVYDELIPKTMECPPPHDFISDDRERVDVEAQP